MRLSRETQFDLNNPSWLYCTSRCARGGYLCGEGFDHRSTWIEARLKLLSRCYAVDVGTYAIMNNHVHVVAYPRPDLIEDWSAQRIARSWWCMRYNVDPVEGSIVNGVPVIIDEADIARRSEDDTFISLWRTRMSSVSWFMKAMKEPVARMVNVEENYSGGFWEGRFKSVPLLDVGAVIACMAYVDLNPIRSQLAQKVEHAGATGLDVRIAQQSARQSAVALRDEGNTEEASSILCAAGLIDNSQQRTATEQLTTQERQNIHNDEDIFRSWLTPIHEMTDGKMGDTTSALAAYLTLIEETRNVIRIDKRGAIPQEVIDILQRLDSAWNPETWMDSMATTGSFAGSVIGNTANIAQEAIRCGKRRIQCRSKLFARSTSTD